MRILSCHIENFGKLHDYSADFRDGANIVCQENGWGKSTFVAFLRAMFYGLEGDRKRSLEENERKRYKPWQGGVFGGQLVFEIRGKEYQISRIFRDKEANDEFELRDVGTNLLSRDYSARIGEEIFKINRESFMRTILIGQSQCETSPTDDINAKIGSLADNESDLNSFEKAYAKLTEIINAMNPNRITGSIAKRKEEIAGYERIVRGGQGISDSISQYQQYLHQEEASLEDLKLQLKEAGERQSQVSRVQSLLAKRAEWKRLQGVLAEKKQEKERLQRRFPGEIPDPGELRDNISRCEDRKTLQERVRMYELSPEEKRELSLLTDVFAEGVPSDAEWRTKREEIARIRDLRQACAAEQMDLAEKERLQELEAFREEDPGEAAEMIRRWSDRNAKKEALEAKRGALASQGNSLESIRRRQAGKASLLFVLGGLLILAGVVILAAAVAVSAFSPVLGIPVLLAGVILLIGGAAANRGKARHRQLEVAAAYEEMRREIAEDEILIDEAENEVAAYLTAHGRIFDEYTASVALQEITGEALEYRSLREKRRRAENSARAGELESLRRTVEGFLGRYGAVPRDSGFSDELYELKSKAERYKALQEKKGKVEKAEREYGAVSGTVLSFLNRYGFEPSADLSRQFMDMRDLVNAWQDAAEFQKKAERELAQFEGENDLAALQDMPPEESLPSFEELNQTIRKLTEDMEEAHGRIRGYNSTLESLQRDYDEWEESCAALQELEKLQAAEKEKYRLVIGARKRLETAKEALTARYAAPIYASFDTYYKMISGGGSQRFHIDANTNVTVDELGKQRETAAFSSGCRDLIGICLRIALVDAMYQEEAPVLIMDDPFANLDDRKLNACRGFLEKLGEKYQIIYFTCSASRG